MRLWVIIALAVIAAIFFGVVGASLTSNWWGMHERNRLEDQLVEANEQVEREQASDRATQETGEAVAQAVDRVQYTTRTIIKEIPNYVTREADASGNITDGFVRLHDAAATGTAPVPFRAGESPDAPSGLATSTVAASVVDNYGTCNTWREQVIGWQSWYNTQRELWDGEKR